MHRPQAVRRRRAAGARGEGRRRVAAFAAAPLATSPLVVPGAAAQETGAGRIEGRITDASGAPSAGAVVRLESSTAGALIDSAGSFRLDGVRPGAQRVRATRIGFRESAVEVEVRPGRAARIGLVLAEAPIELGGVTVIGTREELAELKDRLRRIPGGVALVEESEIRSTRQANLRDVLRFTPGVYVQPRFGAADESQLSIRGSGLRNNFHLRGVNVLVNGMPYRNADGFSDFESLELLTAENVQVFRGANALRYGGSMLGGAVNIETKTGHTADPLGAFGEGGGFGFVKGQVSSGAAIGDADYYASYARTSLDGYRAFASQERHRLNAHLGYRLSDRLDARGFYFYAHVAEQLPGSLTRREMEASPRAANPENVADRWGRTYDLHHIGVQLRAQLSPSQRLTAVLGLRYDRSVREVEDSFLPDGDQTDRRVYEALLPRAGLLYEASAGVQLFANASRSWEPPLLLELNSLTVPGFVDLDAQEAWQFELGTRGRAGPVSWDVAAYEMELRNEIHNLNVEPFPGAGFTVPTYRNSARTRHYGVETGVEVEVPLRLLTALDGGDRLRVRVAHTFGRFVYVEDARFEGSRIPGAPEHVLQAEVRWRHPSGLSLAPDLEWVPGSWYVDSANRVRNDGWLVLGARAEWRVERQGLTLFAAVRNLTDRVYSPSVQVDDAAGRYFEPADGRSVYAGIRWTP